MCVWGGGGGGDKGDAGPHHSSVSDWEESVARETRGVGM